MTWQSMTTTKRLIVEKGGIPILAKLLKRDCSVEEKTFAAKGIWTLAFLKENKEKLRKNRVLYTVSKTFSTFVIIMKQLLM